MIKVLLATCAYEQDWYGQERIVNVDLPLDYAEVSEEDYKTLVNYLPNGMVILALKEKEEVANTIEKILNKIKKEKKQELERKERYAQQEAARKEKSKERKLARAKKLLEQEGIKIA